VKWRPTLSVLFLRLSVSEFSLVDSWLCKFSTIQGARLFPILSQKVQICSTPVSGGRILAGKPPPRRKPQPNCALHSPQSKVKKCSAVRSCFLGRAKGGRRSKRTCSPSSSLRMHNNSSSNVPRVVLFFFYFLLGGEFWTAAAGTHMAFRRREAQEITAAVAVSVGLFYSSSSLLLASTAFRSSRGRLLRNRRHTRAQNTHTHPPPLQDRLRCRAICPSLISTAYFIWLLCTENKVSTFSNCRSFYER